MTTGIETARLIEAAEFTVRMDWADIIKGQRLSLPVREIITINEAPVGLQTQWINDFTDWFLRRKNFWNRIWNRAINALQLKFTAQEAFDDYIEQRASTIGLELALVNAKVIDEVLRQHAIGSVGNLQRALKSSIGLDPRQFSAFVKQSALLRKNFPPERAERMIERLYNKKLNFRAKRIARTEISNAVNQAQLSDIEARISQGELPAAMEKSWSTVGDNRVSEKCMENENQGWIPITEEFESGHDRPPRFPGCRCGVQFRRARQRRVA